MSLVRAKKLIPISLALVALLAAGFIVQTSCSFAESKRPEKGSVKFGSEKRPDVKLGGMEAFKSVVADVAEKVVPTVVSVIPTKIDTVVFTNNPFYQFFGDPFGGGGGMEEFFGQPMPRQRGQRAQPPVEKREYRQQGLGSGVIVSKDGYILTNFHVVAGANEIEVKTSDSRSFQAELVGSDSLADVAVLKIKGKVSNLPVAFLGNSDKLRPGDWAIAVGNPFSLTSSVTMGIVSALKRATGMGKDNYQNFIQTDAAINPGNSGGALVNIEGELIGINTMIYSQSGGYMGIGFAIPINMARQIMEDLIYEGKVTRGWLGVMIQDIDPATRDALKIPSAVRGVLIGDVFKGQPADKAGIKRGDVVTTVNGRPVESSNDLRNSVAAIHPGVKVPVELLRDGKTLTVSVVLTERDPKKANTSSMGDDKKTEEQPDLSDKLGLTVGPMTEQTYDDFGLDPGIKGVVITQVDQGSVAGSQGIKPGDIILEVNRLPVKSVKDFKQATRQVKEGDSILLLLLRDGNTFFKAFKIQQ